MGNTKRLVANLAIIVAISNVAAETRPALAEVIQLKATLTSAAEIPPIVSGATGQANFTYNTATKQLAYTVTYRGLTGQATAGHIHGPATSKENAGVVVPFVVPESPITGTATLSNQQAAALAENRLYVDIHTNANKSGEIRGQIVK